MSDVARQPPTLPREFRLLGTPQPLRNPSGRVYYWVALVEHLIFPTGRGCAIYGPVTAESQDQDLLFFQASEVLALCSFLLNEEAVLHSLAELEQQN